MKTVKILVSVLFIFTVNSKNEFKAKENPVYLKFKDDVKVGEDSIKNEDTKECILFGIDISHYQSKIKWSELITKENNVSFVIVRATMGDRNDIHFKENFDSAKICHYIGAYHYFDYRQNSIIQAQNYINTVNLIPGNFRPILDIENKGQKQSKDSLRAGVKNWLLLVEDHYGVKPIIYSGLKFYNDNLMGYFDEYPVWLAAYNPDRLIDSTFSPHMHQYTNKIKIQGIGCNVDGNLMPAKHLNHLLIK